VKIKNNKGMEYKFGVVFLDEASRFLDGLDEKSKEKILYNIWKVRISTTNDKKLFKKLQDEIWEFRTLYDNTCYRLFAFWDKSDRTNTLVVATHGIIKKADKISTTDIAKANDLRDKYFNENANENLHIRGTDR
jgi:phage-related protein